MNLLARKGDRTSGADEGKVKPAAAAVAGLLSHLAETISCLCMRTALVLGSCYLIFLVYITITYPRSWVEKLQLLPLLIVAITIPLLGAVMIRK